MSAIAANTAPAPAARILVVEDRPVDREYLRTVLGYGGYAVSEAADGATALEIVRSERPDLVITDLMMPSMDGYALVRSIRAEAEIAQTRVIFLSATDRCRDASQLTEALGAMRFVQKPVEPEVLLALVADVLHADTPPPAAQLAAAELDRSHLRLLNDRLAEKAAALEREVFERRSAEAALRESEQRIASIIESAMDAIISIDGEQRIVLFNSAAEKMFGLAASDALGQPLDRLIPKRYRAAHAAHVHEFARTGVSSRTMGHLADLSALRSDGSEFPIEASISQARIGDQPLLTVILRDISERKRHEGRRDTLIHELNHRVKNTLAVVSSFATQTAASAASPDAFVPAFMARVQALSGAHDLLTRADWVSATLTEVAHLVAAPYGAERFHIDGPRVVLLPGAAVTLTLAFHELATNAVKYGALSAVSGYVSLTWAHEAERVDLLWQERDGPPVRAPDSRGFGSLLIEQIVAYELEGECQLQFPPEGVACCMRLPLNSKVRVAS